MIQSSLFKKPPKYILDTCSFSELKYRYCEDVFQSVWVKIFEKIEEGLIISCEEVYEELLTQDDEFISKLSEHKDLFVKLDSNVEKEVTQILSEHPKILDIKKKKSGADPFLIATAKAYTCTVVTEERYSNSPNIEKIPDVCSAYQIKCITFLDMLRELEIKV